MNEEIVKKLDSKELELEEYVDFDYYEYETNSTRLLCLYCSMYNGVTNELMYLSHDICIDAQNVEEEIDVFFDFVHSLIEMVQY